MTDVVPVTVPTPLSMDSDVALLTLQDNVLDCPAAIDVGLALNEAMTGTPDDPDASVVACTDADIPDEWLAGSCAVTEYV